MTLNEPVSVVASFAGGKAVPHRFRMGNRVYDIKQINLIHATREGRARIVYFSVSDALNFWKLRFDTENFEWRVCEQYST